MAELYPHKPCQKCKNVRDVLKIPPKKPQYTYNRNYMKIKQTSDEDPSDRKQNLLPRNKEMVQKNK